MFSELVLIGQVLLSVSCFCSMDSSVVSFFFRIWCALFKGIFLCNFEMIYIWYLIVIDRFNPQKNILIKKPFYFIAVLHIQVDRQVLQQWENVSKILFIKMFWFVFINLTNNDSFISDSTKEDRRSSPKWKTWRNIGNVSRIKWFCCLWRFLEVAGYLQMGRQSWMLRWPTSQTREDGRLRCSLATYDSYRLTAYACRRGLWDVMLKFSGDYLVSFLGSSPHGKMMQPN